MIDERFDAAAMSVMGKVMLGVWTKATHRPKATHA